jgi:hypothetical protein
MKVIAIMEDGRSRTAGPIAPLGPPLTYLRIHRPEGAKDPRGKGQRWGMHSLHFGLIVLRDQISPVRPMI